MKILHNNQTIYYSVPDKDWFYFKHTTNVPLETLEIDELDPDNKEVCQDLLIYGNQGRFDDEGNGKYYIENGELYQRDNWLEHIEEYEG